MVYTDKWFFEQGKNEGHFGVRLLNTETINEDNNHSFMMGYAHGAMARAEETLEERKMTDLAKVGYVRSIGHAVAASGYPASDEHLSAEDKLIFEAGYQSGLLNAKQR